MPSGNKQPGEDEKQFDVALSFADEDRGFVGKVAAELSQMGIKVFYDKYERASLWGKDLYEHLVAVYRDMSRYTVIFCSKAYAGKLWTTHERRAAQERALRMRTEYVLPARFDATEIPGILATTGYVDLRECSPEEFAQLIKEKIGPIRRKEYFPKTPDRLYAMLEAESTKLAQNYAVVREKQLTLAHAFFDSLTLMTPEERWVLANLMSHTCPNGPPADVHMDLELLSRLLGTSSMQIRKIFSRLSCLGYNASAEKSQHDAGDLCKCTTALSVSFKPLAVGMEDENGTFAAMCTIMVLFEELCPECRKRALDDLDFSILSSKTGFSERRAAAPASTTSVEK
jgi:hypothetical protein